MLHHKTIVPWRCHICGRQFEMAGGGICKECGKATCNICFGLAKLRRLGQFKKPDSRVCKTCAGATSID